MSIGKQPDDSDWTIVPRVITLVDQTSEGDKLSYRQPNFSNSPSFQWIIFGAVQVAAEAGNHDRKNANPPRHHHGSQRWFFRFATILVVVTWLWPSRCGAVQ
jgi:hypothetical protein